MRIERVTDPVKVKGMVTLPHIWRHAADDTCPSPDEYFPQVDGGNIWVLVEGEGLFYFVDLGMSMWEVHIGFLRSAYGKALEYCKTLMDWFKQNIDPRPTFLAAVPVTNRVTIGLVSRMGFRYIGAGRKPFMKHGRQIEMSTYVLEEQ